MACGAVAGHLVVERVEADRSWLLSIAVSGSNATDQRPYHIICWVSHASCLASALRTDTKRYYRRRGPPELQELQCLACVPRPEAPRAARIMKIFVTGATGVIGRGAVPLLVAAGHAVPAVARSPAKAQRLSAGARRVDVSLFDTSALDRAVAGHDAVITLATHMPSSS